MNYQGYKDEVLISLIQKSDEDAFTELFGRYWKDLYSSALKRMSSGDDAKDIIQELFVKLWTKRQSLPGDMEVCNYLFAALKYSIINYLQADKLRLHHANLILQTVSKTEASIVESQIDSQDLEVIIEQAIEYMPDRMKEVFILKYKNGYTPQEIAAQLSLNVQSVKNYLTNARGVLRAIISRYNPEVYARLLLLDAFITIW